MPWLWPFGPMAPDSVESSVEPLSVVMTFSPPLMSITTSPEEVSFAFA